MWKLSEDKHKFLTHWTKHLMGAGERSTPGKALAHPFITMSHLIESTSTAASKCVCVCVCVSPIRSLLLRIGFHIRDGAVSDGLRICWWLNDQACWQWVSLPVRAGPLAALWMSTLSAATTRATRPKQARSQQEKPQLWVHPSATVLHNALLISRSKTVFTFAVP